MTHPPCSRCGEPSVFLDRGTGDHLCTDHLSLRVEEAFRAAIEMPGGLAGGERIAVAFSGGKDSSVLLYLLATIGTPELDLELVAVTVDEGIAGYRDATVAWASSLAARLGVEHRVVAFDEAASRDLDTLVRGREGRACSVCGILRRRCLQRAARELGADRLATGHCLDDEAESVLMNWLRGDLYRVAGARPEGVPGLVPRIKPLGRLSEKEVVSYALLHDLAPELPECPYAHTALRTGVRGLVHRAELRFPGSLLRIVDGQAGLEARAGGLLPPADFSLCPRCGEPVLGGTCRACSILGEALQNH